MERKTDIIRLCRLLLIIPMLFLLFACNDENDHNSAVDNTVNSQELIQNHRECIQAPLLNALYDATSTVTMGMYAHMTQGAMALMMIAFAIWLAWKMMAHVSSFTEESPAEIWTDVLKKLFLCIVCGLLASSTTGVIWVLNSIIFPIYDAFLELGSAILGTISENQNIQADKVFDFSVNGQNSEAQYNIMCTVPELDPATPEGFPTAPKQMMECLVCATNERLSVGFSLGWTIMTTSPGFTPLICGLVLIAIFLFTKISFVFYLVDSIFRFAMMVLIMPILIMAFAFKTTRKWTTTGFLTILNSGAFMMCIAIVILMCIAALQQILSDNYDIIHGDITTLSDFSKPILMFLLVGFLLVKSMGIAHSIVQVLVGGGGATNFQKRIGTLLANSAKWVIVGLATAGWGLGVRAALAHSKKARSLNSSWQDFQRKLRHATGEDEEK